MGIYNHGYLIFIYSHLTKNIPILVTELWHLSRLVCQKHLTLKDNFKGIYEVCVCIGKKNAHFTKTFYCVVVKNLKASLKSIKQLPIE